MYYKFKATKDTFISSQSYDHNFGKDEMILIGKTIPATGSVKYPTRALIQFNIDDINNKISQNVISGSSIFELKLYECKSSEVNYDNFYIDVYLVSQSWNEGTGSYYFNSSGSYASWISASNDSVWSFAGGDYISEYSCSQYYPTASGDLSIDVTSLIGYLTSSTYDNNGFLLKFRNETEEGNFNNKYYYSHDTHTIYEPILLAKWNDMSIAGSVTASATWKDYVINLQNKKQYYNIDEKILFKTFVREKYPVLSYSTSSIQNLSNTPLVNLEYQIVDKSTNEVVIPFSQYSSCSYDDTENYFYVDMSIFHPYRTYDLYLKHEFSSSIQMYKVHTFITEE